MTQSSNPRRPKSGTWTPQPETVALLRVSGNSTNRVADTMSRQPSPFFWHPPDQPEAPGNDGSKLGGGLGKE